MANGKFIKELLILFPVFLLQLNSGLMSTFTTVVKSDPDSVRVEGSTETVLDIMDDLPTIIIAILGGLLQKIFSPKLILIVSAVPGFLSWIFLALDQGSVSFLLLSRASAGLANGLTIGNIYVSDVATYQFLGSFKIIELLSKGIGYVLTFLVLLGFRNILGLSGVALVFASIPTLSFIGLLCSGEDKCRIKKCKTAKTSMRKEITEAFDIPISSPAIYSPFTLGIILLFLQCLCGDSYIGKNMIQILNTDQCFHSGETKNMTNLTYSENQTNSSCQMSQVSSLKLSLIIQSVKLIVIMSMTFLVRRFRLRFLYFTSLILTGLILLCLGFISDNSILTPHLPPNSVNIFKTVLLCLHIICIQFGLHTLPSLLMDVLYPSSFKAMLKGISLSIGNLFLIALISVLKIFNFSEAFWILSGLVFLAIPFLYIYLPEVRNIGTNMSADFFLPFQTVFYFPLPALKKSGSSDYSEHNVSFTNQAFNPDDIGSGINFELFHLQTVQEMLIFKPQVSFNQEIHDIENIATNKEYEILNKQRVNFVSNILSQNGFLARNKDKSRILLGRGIVKFGNQLRYLPNKGCVFLFSDVLIVARCIKTGRKYVAETFFRLNSPSFSVRSEGVEIIFTEKCVEETVKFEDPNLCKSWDRYIQSARSRMVSLLQETLTTG